jgi:hypothetical protein
MLAGRPAYLAGQALERPQRGCERSLGRASLRGVPGHYYSLESRAERSVLSRAHIPRSVDEGSASLLIFYASDQSPWPTNSA